MTQSDPEAVLAYRNDSLDVHKRSVIDNFKAGVAGGLILGVGVMGEAAGLLVNNSELKLGGIAPIIIGGLLVKDCYRDVRDGTDLIIEDQTRIVQAKTQIESRTDE